MATFLLPVSRKVPRTGPTHRPTGPVLGRVCGRQTLNHTRARYDLYIKRTCRISKPSVAIEVDICR